MLLDGTGAQVMLKTNFLIKKTPDNTGNFVLLDIDDAPESLQYPGGLTRMDWKWGLSTYNYEPDAMVDDPTDYSTNLLNFIDQIRQHFSLAQYGANGQWLSTEMANVFDTYGFQMTFFGITKADPIDQDGVIMGFKIDFESTALDSVTDYVIDTVIAQNVNQVDNPPFGPNEPIS